MRLANAADALRLLGPLVSGGGGERVAIAFLERDGRVLGTRLEEGQADQAELPAPAILREALRLGAAGLVVAHNHPGGDPTPSQADLMATRRLAAAATALGLRLHDHLIIAGGRRRSLRAMGLL
jgi:DNA repair protein RadC